MTRITLIACLFLAAVLLAGCGGGGGGSTASTSASTAAQTPPPSPHREPSSEAAPKDHFSSPPSSAQAPHDSATGAASFEAKGADNSIQESGSQGSGSELREAATALHGYLDARAAAQWAKACSYLAGDLTAQFSQLAPDAKGKQAPSCAKILASLSASIPAAARREAVIAHPGALRIEGDRAFLLFHGAHGVNYFMPVAREDGKWKVAAIAASALP